jgi:hypothetical protein
MCGRVFDPEEVSETKLNPLKGRTADRWLWTLPRRYNVPPTMPLAVMASREGVRTPNIRYVGLNGMLEE